MFCEHAQDTFIFMKVLLKNMWTSNLLQNKTIFIDAYC